MSLALDEPRTNDEKVEAEGLSFLLSSDVADMIRSLWEPFHRLPGPSVLLERVSAIPGGGTPLLTPG